MAISWSDVVLIAPDLASLTVDQQDAILADVALQLSSDKLGDLYDLASKYLAAHMGTLVLRGINAPGGPLTSESVGDVSRSYASGIIKDSDLDSTSYGRQFNRIIRLTAYRVGFVL